MRPACDRLQFGEASDLRLVQSRQDDPSSGTFGVKVRVKAALTVLLAVGLGSASAAHPGQFLGLKIQVADEELTYELLISADYLGFLTQPADVRYGVKRTRDGYDFLEERQREQLKQVLADLLSTSCPVEVDGVRILPVARDLIWVPPEGPEVEPDELAGLPPDAKALIAYPLKGRPRRVSMIWGLYPEDYTRVMAGLDPALDIAAELDAYDENRIITFKPDEPAYVWHAENAPLRERVTTVAVRRPVATMRVPVLSLVLALAALGGGALGLLVIRQQVVRRVVLGSALLLLGGAPFVRGQFVREWPAPWSPRVALPDQGEAAEIFTALHRNVYRAFDYKRESDIYDVLAQSVNGVLLDAVYNEVFQSLIMRDQGGAVARIQEVEVLSADVEQTGVVADNAAAFCVLARWRVRGAVYHWGHVHERLNEYAARYTVAQEANNWKITAVDVLEQQRITADPNAAEPATSDPG